MTDMANLWQQATPIYEWPCKSMATSNTHLWLTWQIHGNKQHPSMTDLANPWQQHPSMTDLANPWQQATPIYDWPGKSMATSNTHLWLAWQIYGNKQHPSMTDLANLWPQRGSPRKPAAEECWSPPSCWRWRPDRAAGGQWGRLVLWGPSVCCGWSGSETGNIFLIQLLASRTMGPWGGYRQRTMREAVSWGPPVCWGWSGCKPGNIFVAELFMRQTMVQVRTT